MTFEKYIARLNGLAFWAEFTFAQNKFMPRPGQEVELTDNLIWLGKYAFVLQLKQRGDETEDPEVERSWFQNKVLNKATRQVRDTMRFLGEHKQIRITNERGHAFEIRSAELTQITKVVVFLGARALPRDCWQTDDVPRSVENAKRSLPCLQYQLMLLRQAFVCLSCLIAFHSECRALPAAWEVVCKPSACESLSWLPASPQPSSARP
jgi:hypothetical protein